MANLVLTSRCNRDCAYCFADKTPAVADMTLAAAERILDLALASGLQQVRLLGGEPTLHPDFGAILNAGVRRGLEVLVFSNGLLPPAALEAIQRTPPSQCRVMLNLNLGGADAAAHRAQSAHTAAALGPRAFVGVNLHSPGLPLLEAAQFAKTHGLARVIRVGMAHPRLDRRNLFLQPRHYRGVGAELEAFLKAIHPDGFSLSLDCGFVPCMFSHEFLELAGVTPRALGRRCGPIPDVQPDLSAIHCFALSEMDQLPLGGGQRLQEVRELLEVRAGAWRTLGVFRECTACALRRQGDCLGGCLATALLRAHRTPLPAAVAAPAARAVHGATAARSGPTSAPWAIPYIDQGPAFWEALAAEFGGALREVYFPIGIPGLGTGRPVAPAARLDELLAARVVPLAVLVNPLVLPAPLEQIGGRIVDELARLYEEYGVAAATLSDVRLAERVRQRLPALRLTASCLLEVTDASQAQALRGVFDVLVPATRLTRRPARLAAVGAAFRGPLRLLVNEGCLDACLDRKQHFYEMAQPGGMPRSLCAERLARDPWLRLTGAWVLPQHLHLLDACADEFKLAGRGTLEDPEQYRLVLRAYVRRQALWPHETGGGPAAISERTALPRDLFSWLLSCDHLCADCSICRRAAAGQPPPEVSA